MQFILLALPHWWRVETQSQMVCLSCSLASQHRSFELVFNKIKKSKQCSFRARPTLWTLSLAFSICGRRGSVLLQCPAGCPLSPKCKSPLAVRVAALFAALKTFSFVFPGLPPWVLGLLIGVAEAIMSESHLTSYEHFSIPC